MPKAKKDKKMVYDAKSFIHPVIDSKTGAVSFTDDEGNAAWGLCLWFDNMRRMYEGYRDVTPTKKKRKRKLKKQVA